MNKRIKKGIALLTCFVMALGLLSGTSFTSNALDIGPRSIISVPKITFNPPEVDGGGIIDVTIQFTDTMQRVVPFSVELTKGAVILADDLSDIVFKTNNVVKPITKLDVSPDGVSMDLITGIVTKNKPSTFTFKVEAPIDASNFQVILDTDSSNALFKTVASNPVKIVSGLTIEAPDLVDDVDPFDVYGLATYKGQNPPANSHMFMEIVHTDPTKPYFYEVQLVESIVNGEYKFSGITLPTDYEDGKYLIKVYLYDNDTDTLIGYVEKEVEFKKRPDVLQVQIYCQQRGVYVTRNNPLPGEGVLYKGLYVWPATGWYVPDDPGHGDHNIQASATLKKLDEVKQARDAKFIVKSSFPDQPYDAVKTNNKFTGNLRPLRTTQTMIENGVERRPYIILQYTLNGEVKEVFIGELEPIIDPAGYVYDSDTKVPIEGAIATLYKYDEEDEMWLEWEDPNGVQLNPQTTAADGKYAWDVESGSFDIKIYHPDYHKDVENCFSTMYDPNYGIIVVPPERFDINVGLKKPAPEPEEPEPIEEPEPEPEPEEEAEVIEEAFTEAPDPFQNLEPLEEAE